MLPHSQQFEQRAKHKRRKEGLSKHSDRAGLGVAGGTLNAGVVADVTIVDPAAEWRVEAAALKSRSKNSPFLGWTMKGRAIYTLVGGRIVYEAPRK